jgi:hypothetical protein
MSADPYKASGYMTDPQSWNRYSYTSNDPVNKVDDLGLQETPVTHNDNGSPISWPGVTVNAGQGGTLLAGGGSEVDHFLVEDPPPNDTGLPGSVGPSIEDLLDKFLKWLAKGKDVTPCELALARKTATSTNPADAGRAFVQVKESEKIADKYEKDHGGAQDNNPVNARKHCIYSCEMSKRMDQEFAREWGDAHECGGQGPQVDMDYHNNWIGRTLSIRSKQENTVQIGGTPSPGNLYAIRP